MIRWLRALVAKDRRVSASWLQQQQRNTRVEFHGVAISFPIRKFENENPRRMQIVPRRSA